MIGLSVPLLAVLSLPPLPPPPYPYDRSIECRLLDFDGRRVATWTGKVLGAESEGSRFKLQLTSSHSSYGISDSFAIPDDAKLFSLQRPEESTAVADIRDWDPNRGMCQARLTYEIEMANTWHDRWLVNVKSQFEPIATGMCSLGVIIPNEELKVEDAQ